MVNSASAWLHRITEFWVGPWPWRPRSWWPLTPSTPELSSSRAVSRGPCTSAHPRQAGRKEMHLLAPQSHWSRAYPPGFQLPCPSGFCTVGARSPRVLVWGKGRWCHVRPRVHTQLVSWGQWSGSMCPMAPETVRGKHLEGRGRCLTGNNTNGRCWAFKAEVDGKTRASEPDAPSLCGSEPGPQEVQNHSLGASVFCGVLNAQDDTWL